MSEWAFILVHVGAALLLLGLSACFSAAETALFSLTRTEVHRLTKSPGQAERAAVNLLQDPSRLLATILIGNTVVNIAFASLIGLVCRQTLGEYAVAAAIVASTVLLLVAGEITPKMVAAARPGMVARGLALPIDWLSTMLTPVHALLRGFLAGVMRLFGQRHVPAWGILTREEIAGLLVDGAAAGATSARGRELAENLLELPLIIARDTMVPRTEVCGVPDSLTLAEACALACSHRHSRLPVYHEDLDDIWGWIALTDMPRWRRSPALQRRLGEFRPRKGQPAPAPESSPVRPVQFFPETAPVERLLTDMRRRQIPLAVLVDEYGGTAGILTQQDILAEILGRLATQRPGEAPLFVTTAQGVLVEGQASIRELNRALDLGLDADAADTVGGLVMAHLGRLPRAGDAVATGRLRFHVIRMSGRRIGALRIERVEEHAWEGDAI